jgi:hypothetical protein
MRAGVVTTNAGLTVTRASSGYAETSDGRLVSFGSGVLRHTDKGLLVEGARTNLLTYSQAFDDAAWSKVQSSVNANVVTAPDGTLTADTFLDALGQTYAEISESVNFALSGNYVLSIFAKQGTRRYVFMALPSAQFGSNVDAYFDLQDGVVKSTGASAVSASIQTLANGWCRCILVGNATSTGSGSLFVYHVNASGDSVFYTGDGAGSLYLWGAQVEAGAFASSYIATIASAVTRAADEVTASLTSVVYPASLYAEFARNGDTGTAEGVLQVDASSRAQRANINVSSSDTLSATARGGANDGDAAVSGAITVGAITKGAGRIAVNDVQAARAGTLATADTAASVPTSSPDTVRFGDFGATATYSSLYLRRAAVISSALTDTQLQAITT